MVKGLCGKGSLCKDFVVKVIFYRLKGFLCGNFIAVTQCLTQLPTQ